MASRKNLDNVWQQADQELCRDEKKKEIFDAYIKILEAKYGENLAARGSPEYQDQMKKLLDTKTEELGKIKWKSRAATASRTILHAKDLIDTAVSASPPAVIACAGVSVILKVSEPTSLAIVTGKLQRTTCTEVVVLSEEIPPIER